MDEKAVRNAALDAEVAERHAGFDLSAQDNHMKYERASFVVVTATEAYRDGIERMFPEYVPPYLREKEKE